MGIYDCCMPTIALILLGYYIYSDSANPGGSLALIGKVPLGDCNFTDWGPSLASGYGAPAYVPTTAPVSAQAQMLSTTIASGGGTTSLVLNANAGQTITSLGATIMYDDAPNFAAACNAAAGATSLGGSVLLSPPTSNSDDSQYIFNSPVTVPEFVNIIFGCGCIINETITFTAYNHITSQFGSSYPVGLSFGTENFCSITGYGNPYIFMGENSGNTGGIRLSGLGFAMAQNGQTAIIDTCFYTEISNCGFKSTNSNNTQGTTKAIIYLGSCSLGEAKDLNWTLHHRFYGNGIAGQSAWGPSRLPAIWFRGSTNTALPNYNDCTGQFLFSGNHSANGRGITLDQQYSSGNLNQPQFQFGDNIWLQQGTTPIVTCIGDIFYGIDIINILNDTSNTPTLFNGAANLHDASIKYCSVGNGYGVVSGNPVTNLSASGNSLQNQYQCQRVLIGSLTSTSAQSDVVSMPGYSGAGSVTLVPTNASAALDIASGLAYISSKNSGSVTVSHSFTANMTFDVISTEGN